MITIAGVKISQQPAELKVGRFDITKSGRTASGDMVMDIIATKRRVDCTWRMMPDGDLKLLIDTIQANKPFFPLAYPDAGGTETMVCYAGDINTSLWHTINGVRYWQEVTVSFIER